MLLGTVIGLAMCTLAVVVGANGGDGALFVLLLAFIASLEPILNNPQVLVNSTFLIAFLTIENVFFFGQLGDLPDVARFVRSLWVGSVEDALFTNTFVSTAVVRARSRAQPHSSPSPRVRAADGRD